MLSQMTEVEAILDRYPTIDEIPTAAEIRTLYEHLGEVCPGSRHSFRVTFASGEYWDLRGRIHAWEVYHSRYVNTVKNPWGGH